MSNIPFSIETIKRIHCDGYHYELSYDNGSDEIEIAYVEDDEKKTITFPVFAISPLVAILMEFDALNLIED